MVEDSGRIAGRSNGGYAIAGVATKLLRAIGAMVAVYAFGYVV